MGLMLSIISEILIYIQGVCIVNFDCPVGYGLYIVILLTNLLYDFSSNFVTRKGPQFAILSFHANISFEVKIVNH